MIGLLKGQLVHSEPPALLIMEVNGVGYEVEVPSSVFYELPELNRNLTLIIHHLVREDASILYGFRSYSQRQLFRSLLKVNGIGAKSALAILSTMSSVEFSQVIYDQDITALTRVPGVGKKTAQRLIIEMKDKVDVSGLSSDSISGSPSRLGQHGEAISALQSLGFKPQDARQMVTATAKDNPDLTVEEIVRRCLQQKGGA